jgi:aquaporin Z
MNDSREQPPLRQRMLAEMAGTALLLLLGLSLVTVMFGAGSPVVAAIPDHGLRRAITGFLFGTIGASVAVSRIGRISGAHINPAVTLGFWLMRKLDARVAIGYVCAQVVGACVGVLPLLFWGAMGRSVAFGATAPGPGYTVEMALVGEVITTFTMVSLLAIFLGFRNLRAFTPAMFPFLYAAMSYVEAPISGTSTNPARSLGPALISGQWDAWWIYWVGPVIGTGLATVACSVLANRIEGARLYHFDSDRGGMFRKMTV